MRDVLPGDMAAWEALEAAARRQARLRGYREIRPALLEETELFTRSVGEVTDIVEKEMFTVVRGDTSLTLRPEGTAGIVRAYLEAGYAKTNPIQRLFNLGPMFRYERPQKGRERMFTQFDVEVLGSLDPRLDAEVVHLAVSFFEDLGLGGLEVRLNSMGDGDDRDRYRDAVRAFLAPNIEEHCELCRTRFERNVLRVLDCKNPECVKLHEGAPHIVDFLGDENREHFETVQELLRSLDRNVQVDPGIVRGLDYYTRTVFEIHFPELGTRSALCGGGRYDHLMRDLGGPDLGAVGCAIGFSPTFLALEAQGVRPGSGDGNGGGRLRRRGGPGARRRGLRPGGGAARRRGERRLRPRREEPEGPDEGRVPGRSPLQLSRGTRRARARNGPAQGHAEGRAGGAPARWSPRRDPFPTRALRGAVPLLPPLSEAARRARRLGVFGGSFDPPHAGHLHVARSARAALDLDHVLFVPAARPPHKPGRELAAGEMRVRMLELLLAGRSWATVWAGELRREGPSFTVDTLLALADELGSGTELFLILGSDNLADLPRWRDAERLLSLARPAVVLRRGSSLDVTALAPLSSSARARVEAGTIDVEPVDVSASEIRAALLSENAGDVPGLPSELVEFIRRNRLYGTS